MDSEERARLPGYAQDAVVRHFDAPEALSTRFYEVRAKSILNRVPPASQMPFRWTINPYRGCTHACAYCFARPTHKYLDFNAGRDFEREIVVKVNAPELLRAELARPSWEGEHVALGTNTDPYQWVEGRYKLMPGIWEAMRDAENPCSILTKSPLLLRDLPIMKQIAERTRLQRRAVDSDPRRARLASDRAAHAQSERAAGGAGGAEPGWDHDRGSGGAADARDQRRARAGGANRGARHRGRRRLCDRYRTTPTGGRERLVLRVAGAAEAGSAAALPGALQTRCVCAAGGAPSAVGARERSGPAARRADARSQTKSAGPSEPDARARAADTILKAPDRAVACDPRRSSPGRTGC